MMSEFSLFSWVLTVAVAIAVLALSRPQKSQKIEFQKSISTADAQFRSEVFEQLQTLFVNYPSAVQMALQNPDLPARNLVALFTPLENLLHQWEYKPIGKPWQSITFDPQLHQPDQTDIQPGEMVYVRFVGYRHNEDILCPAKVSRSLPQMLNK